MIIVYKPQSRLWTAVHKWTWKSIGNGLFHTRAQRTQSKNHNSLCTLCSLWLIILFWLFLIKINYIKFNDDYGLEHIIEHGWHVFYESSRIFYHADPISSLQTVFNHNVTFNRWWMELWAVIMKFENNRNIHKKSNRRWMQIYGGAY